MESNYYSKINELETLKDRKKILRQIRQSKEKLFAENPQVIFPYLKNKLSDDYLRNSHQMARIQNSPFETMRTLPTPLIKTAKKDKDDSNVINPRKNDEIEFEIQQLKLTETRNRQDLNDRFEQFMSQQENKMTTTLEEMKSYFKLINQNQMDVQSYRLGNGNVLTELKNLKVQYLKEGGSDSQILRDIDNLIAEAHTNTTDKINNDSNWKEQRKNMAIAREKTIALRELERYNAELERELEMNRFRSSNSKSKLKSPKIDSDLRETLESLRLEILRVQQEILSLKKSTLSENKEITIDLKTDFTPRKLISANKNANFTIILDCITGISPIITSATVYFTVFKDYQEILTPVSLKPISIRPMKKNELDLCMTLNSVQPISNCPVSSTVFGLIHLSLKSKTNEVPNLEAWTRFNLFSDEPEVNEGQWQAVIYNDPIQRFIEEQEMLKLPHFHHAVLHYRILQSPFNFSEPAFGDTVDSSRRLNLRSTSDVIVSNPVPVEPDNNGRLSFNDDEESDVTVDLNDTPEFGFQVIRVKNVAIGDGFRFAQIRLTAYYTMGPKNGEVLMSNIGPVECCSNFVRADFKMACYQFGKQIGQFKCPDLSFGVIVYARFYMENNKNVDTDDELITWTAIPLVKLRRIAKNTPSHHSINLKLLKINKGLHDIPFYEKPVVAPNSISFDSKGIITGQKKFGRAKLKLRIFHTKPVYESATSSSDISSDNDEKKTKQPWIPVERNDPFLSPYLQSDGIDLYVDSGRCWPDSVTIAKVEGRVLNRSLIVQGPKFSTFTSLTSDIYNPEFNERIEIRQPQLSPSSTLLLKIFTFDKEEKNLILFGYAALKIFIETGTNEQPSFDDLGVLVSLNDGGHQIRIYSSGPNATTFPFSESWFESNHIAPVLGATLLIRIYKAPKNAEGESLSIHNTPKLHHKSLGIVLDPPNYDDGYYYSMSCKPNKGELQILNEHLSRPKIILRDLLNSKWSDNLKETVSFGRLHSVSDVIRLFDNSATNVFNMNRIAQYNANYGFKIAFDGCLNIPWASFSAATVSILPPGSLYMNEPLMAYDRPFLVSQLDLTSTPSAPLWTNGWKTYKKRKYDKYLVAIFHLHEMNIKVVGNNNLFSLENQAWVPIQIFEFSYCITKASQLPLIVGAPKQAHLNELKIKPVKQFLIDNLASKNIEFLANASVIVRQCDARRSFELTPFTDNLLTLDQSYIPESKLLSYQSVYGSANEIQFIRMMPKGLTEKLFQQMIRIKFQSLIYKFYGENGFNLK